MGARPRCASIEWLLLLATLLTFVAPPGDPAAASAPASASEAARPRGVHVIMVGASRDRTFVREVLAELLGRIEVDVTWDERDTLDAEQVVRSLDVAAEPDRLATVVVDLQQATGLLYVLDAPGDRILARRIALDGGVDEIAREEIGAITAEAIEALRAGGTIGVAREHDPPQPETKPEAEPEPEPQPNPTPPTAPPPPTSDTAAPATGTPLFRRRWPEMLAATAVYRLAGWSAGSLQHRLEARLALVERTHAVAPRLELSLGAWLPSRVGPDAERIRATGATSHLAAGIDVRLPRSMYLVAAAGVGLDALAVRSRASGGTHGVAVPTVDARLGWGMWLRPGLALSIGPFVIVDLVDVRILAVEDDRVLFDPWRAWPGVELTLGGFVPLIDRRASVPPSRT